MPKPKEGDVERVLQEVEDLLPRFAPRQLETYITDLLAWNPGLGLISKRNSPAVAARLVRQSVALWEFVTSEALAGHAMPCRVADIGTGGGFPGLVWKMIEPRIDLTLIERMGRKAHFLEQVIQRLALPETRVIARDVNEIVRDVDDVPPPFDVVVMMAVATPGALGRALEALIRPGGFLASIRPTSQQIVEQRVGHTISLTKRTDTPMGTFVLYQKTSRG